MSTNDKIKRGLKKAKRDWENYNQKQVDTAYDENADPGERAAYQLDIGLNRIKVKGYSKKYIPKKRK